LDVHRDFCEVAICEDGEVRSAGRVPATPEGVSSLADSLLASDRVALEVTGSCWEVARILEPHVNRVVVVSPDDTGISSARAKTDKLDARALASLLWRGELEAVWMPDERCRILRRRLSRREQLVHSRSRVKNEIHACLQRRLQGKPPCSDLFGVKGRQWLSTLELPLEERESVDAGVRQIEFLDVEVAAVEKLIAQQALSWPEIRRLMTVPGVNLICAASFIAAVGNPNRFLSSRKLVAYLGLDPRVKQSGEGPARSGRISKRGSPSARWALVEAAWTAVLQPGPLQGDRRDRPQARGPVLVHAHPRPGLRPPAALPDPQEAPPPGDHRRRTQIHPPRRRNLVHQRPHARGRTRARPPSRDVLQADGPRPTSWSPGEESGRERDTGARIDLVTQTRTSRAADHKLLTSALRYVISSRPTDNLRRDRRGRKTKETTRPQIPTDTNLTFIGRSIGRC
jgi:transposase